MLNMYIYLQILYIICIYIYLHILYIIHIYAYVYKCIYSKYVYVCIYRKFKSLITFHLITLLFGFNYAYTSRIDIHLLLGLTIYILNIHIILFFMLRCSDEN